MNTINFQQIGGLPLETNTLTEVQKAYSIFNAFGALAGNKTIISGCEVIGNQITNGFIYLDGELLEFRGGIKQDTVVIIQEETKVFFEDQTEKGVYYTRYVTFGVSVNSTLWSDFKRFYINQPIFKEIKYVGRNVTQAELQRGWYIANGENGTDNILGRMLVGYDATQAEFDTVGKKGGEKTHQLTEAEIPSHRHEGRTNSAGGHSHEYNRLLFGGNSTWVSGGVMGYWGTTKKEATSSEGVHQHSFTTDNEGNDKPHNNLPPYIVALPIQFIG
ncbi:phage baseplate protein [Tenacibaculum salmonis]|uniref:phage baseplate protein n=1 Tax=Tenacibaculum sp. P3-BQ1 TaxID=3232310 RepID=UPI0034DE73F3